MTSPLVSAQRLRFNLGFLPPKPLLFGRIAANYARMVLLRQPRLRVLTVAVNYSCQLKCAFCSAQDLRRRSPVSEYLTMDQLSAAIQQAMRCGCVNIHFTGGEPLLDRRLYETARLIDRRRVILSLVSNGLLLAQEALPLKKAGFDLVIVSIDSPDAAAHDAARGVAGAWEKAWEGVDAAQAAGLKAMVAMVVSHQNLRSGEVDRQVSFCRRRGIPLQLLPVRQVGDASLDAASLLSPEDKERYFALTARGDVRWDGCSSYFPARCLAARERIYLDPVGNIFPCDFIHTPFGNIKEEPLEAIWKRMLKSLPYTRSHPRCISAFPEDEGIR